MIRYVGGSKYECRCCCGIKKKVAGWDLRSGRSQSCGCLVRERNRVLSTKHGGHGTYEYGIWKGMRSRCYNRSHQDYRLYGGRGIKVCERWSDFANFLSDVGRCPNPSLSIERIDNDGDYEPGNVRWATAKDQARNRRTNRRLEFRGRSLTLIEWAEVSGVPYDTVRARADRGWSAEDILTVPVRRVRPKRFLKLNGVRRSIVEWADVIGVPANTLVTRLRMGWSVRRTLTTPHLSERI